MGEVIQFRPRPRHFAAPDPLTTVGMIQLAVGFGLYVAFLMFMAEVAKR